MKLHRVQDGMTSGMEIALQEFERQFLYPLGEGNAFSITHGPPYPGFFQAMGPATLLVLEREGEVLGTLVRVERTLECSSPEGSSRKRSHYLCDLKIAPAARGSRALRELMQAARHDILASGFHSCFAIVMGGTGRAPSDYTGRVGIPAFRELGQLSILRFTGFRQADRPPDRVDDAIGGDAHFSTREVPVCRVVSGEGRRRSRMRPQDITSSCGKATGRLEDTLKGKRLWLRDGGELLSAHLSAVRFDGGKAGVDLLKAAVTAAVSQGYPALFVAVPAGVLDKLEGGLQDFMYSRSNASVQGWDLPDGMDWWVDTAEI